MGYFYESSLWDRKSDHLNIFISEMVANYTGEVLGGLAMHRPKQNSKKGAEAHADPEPKTHEERKTEATGEVGNRSQHLENNNLEEMTAWKC